MIIFRPYWDNQGNLPISRSSPQSYLQSTLLPCELTFAGFQDWAVDTFRSHYSADPTQNSPKEPGSRGRINRPRKKFTWKCKLQNIESIEETNHPLPHEQSNTFDFFPVSPLVIGSMQTCFYVITVSDEYNFLCCFFHLIYILKYL